MTLSLLNLRYSSDFHLDTGLAKSPEQWIRDMSSDTFYADGYFVELCCEIMNQEIERYYSVPKEGVVALLVDHSKFGTYVNNKQSLLPNSKTGLKKGDIIGISNLNKDMKKEHYAAFKFSIINSLISENQSFPTLIDLSSNSIQKV